MSRASRYHAPGTSRAVSTTQVAGYEVHDHRYDAVVIAAGGAGPRAAAGLVSHQLKTACITKVFPSRSHTVAAQGCINSTVANMTKDDWRCHAPDTVKGSRLACRPGVMQHMCRLAPEVILELESFGLPFSRTSEGPAGRSNPDLRGEACDDQGNNLLDKFHLDGVPPAPRGAPQIEVTSSNDVPTPRGSQRIVSDMFMHTYCVQHDVE